MNDLTEITVPESSETYQWPVPTVEQARLAYRAVMDYVRATYGYTEEEMPTVDAVFIQDGRGWPDGPVLVRDFALWHSPSAWAVVWEGGAYDWAYLASMGGMGEFGNTVHPAEGLPEGTYLEAACSFAVSLWLQ